MLTYLITCFALVSLTFIAMKVLPGDPFGNDQALPTEILTQLQHHYGLDRPLWTQYFDCLASVLCWNFGYSYKFKYLTVNQILMEGFPISALLGLQAFFLSLSLGLLLGLLFGVKQKQIGMILLTVGISIPSFILATGLQYLFAIQLDWFPVARWDSFWHTVLPTCALAIGPSAFIARLFGARLQEIYSQDYIKLAQAKGLSEWRVAFFHVLPNAILPVLPYLGQLLTGLLVGSFVVEKIFGIPGLGQWFVSSVLYRDYNVIMGITFFYGFLLLSMMLLVDMIALWIEPSLRVRLQ